jgi:hypothetical protein
MATIQARVTAGPIRNNARKQQNKLRTARALKAINVIGNKPPSGPDIHCARQPKPIYAQLQKAIPIKTNFKAPPPEIGDQSLEYSV